MSNRIFSLIATCLLAISANACNDTASDLPGKPGSPERTLAEALQKLSYNQYQSAAEDFQALMADETLVCEAHYGNALASIQDVAARIDTLLDSLAVFLGAAPGLAPTQVNISAVVEEILEPFEESFESIVADLTYAVDNGCSIRLDEGFPLELEAGENSSLIYFKATLGYEFDTAAAQLIRAIYAGLLAGVQLTLSQDLSINVGELDETIEVVLDALTTAPHVEVYAGGVTVPTIVPAVRSLGIVPSKHPKLLTLRDQERWAKVDNSLALMFQSIYVQHSDDIAHGILPAAAAAAKDDNVGDNMLGLIDADGDGYAGEGDSIVIGLRELHVTGLFSIPAVTEGIVLHLNDAIGDVDTVLASTYAIIQNLGMQMAAVDGLDHHGDAVESYERLGLGAINDIIESVTLTNLLLEPLPEAVEFDLAAFFTTPIGFRDLFPIWYDDDGDPDTHAAFLIEGEAWVTNADEPFTFLGDSEHFAGVYEFNPEAADTGGHSHDHDDTDFVPLGALSDLTIPADGIEPLDEAAALSVPLLYSALQSPSLNGMLYANDALLFDSDSDDNRFVKTDSYLFNKTVNSYIKFVVDAWFHL